MIPGKKPSRNPAQPRHRGAGAALQGVTLVELLVAVGIVALLASLAAPSFARLRAGSAVSGHVNTFLADSRFASSEALRRGVSVTMCRSEDPEAAFPACAGAKNPGGWEGGWIIFADEDANNQRAEGEDLLRVQPAMPDSGGIHRGSGAAYNQIRYRPNGWAAGATATLRFLPRSAEAQLDPALGRTLCVSIIGRTRALARSDAACS
ncbi:MAG: GspH/FimT family pseudopilin [Pseudomonadota bacterium]